MKKLPHGLINYTLKFRICTFNSLYSQKTESDWHISSTHTVNCTTEEMISRKMDKWTNHDQTLPYCTCCLRGIQAAWANQTHKGDIHSPNYLNIFELGKKITYECFQCPLQDRETTESATRRELVLGKPWRMEWKCKQIFRGRINALQILKNPGLCSSTGFLTFWLYNIFHFWEYTEE